MKKFKIIISCIGISVLLSSCSSNLLMSIESTETKTCHALNNLYGELEDEFDKWQDLNFRRLPKRPIRELRIDEIVAYGGFVANNSSLDFKDPVLETEITKLVEILKRRIPREPTVVEYEIDGVSVEIIKTYEGGILEKYLDARLQVREILRTCKQRKHITRIDKRIT